MATIRLRHIHRFRDRHGTERFYLRQPGHKAVALPGRPGRAEILAAYQAALAAPKPGPELAAGSLDALAAAWLASRNFRRLKPSTQANYRRHCDHLREKHGSKPVALLDAMGVRKLLTEWGERSATAPQHLLRVLRGLMAYAVETGQLAADPTHGVKRPRHRAEGFRTWSEADIAAYEARWLSGSRERLGFALLLYTGQRRSDIVRMGRQHRSPQMIGGQLRDCISITQVKTGRRVTITIHPALAAEIDQAPADQLTYLTRHDGVGFTSGGFYNLFSEWRAAAGLPAGLAPHGLRKAMSRRLSEHGATTKEAMAILGHSTIGEAERYSREADNAMLAAAGMDRIVNLNSQTSPKSLQTGPKKRRKTVI